MRASLVVTLVLATALAAVPAHAASTLGSRVLKKGHRGNDVAVLQRVLAWKRWRPGPVDGVFGRKTKRAVKRFQRHRGLKRDGKVGPATILALSRSWGKRRATVYGPGLYGNRTACGQRLGRRTLGIAHRTLPCGRRVPTFHNGRIAILRVIDRGPHTRGVHVDLTMASGRKVGLTHTGYVRAGY